MASIYARSLAAASSNRRPARHPSFPVGCLLESRQPETDEGTGQLVDAHANWRVIWADGADRYVASDASGALLVRTVDQIRSGFFAIGGVQ
ncbi:hypothetical protein [Dyella terrae]|uniref:hypothetical protein n=1 Tax=Dyella terrae TaxID=522259 RepID=UPI001EFD493F|nr:hypothetical protein [Dyella terrae]ULU26630.1 hypothetical protein DYST_03576 [Dyella terrae]